MDNRSGSSGKSSETNTEEITMNILTFDIEEWYLEKMLYGGRAFRYRLYDDMFAKILDELDQFGLKATFFCVGKLAAEFPEVVRKIADRGHEIGCHSNEHTWLNRMTEEELYHDTTEALKSLEDVSGQKVVSYRAPAFSITETNKWAVNILAECGIEIDASIFPADRDLGGYKSFPQDTPCILSSAGQTLKEYPICLTRVIGKTMAYSGGGYFRLLPYSLISKTMQKRSYNICYFHLNDLIHQEISFKSRVEYETYYKEPGTLKNRVVRYVKSNIGSANTFEKFMKLLSEHPFVCIRDAEKMMNWEAVRMIAL